MAPARCGWGRGNKGPEPRVTKRSSRAEGSRGRKPAKKFIAEAATTYKEETDEGIRKLINDWEDQVKNELEPDDEI